MASIFAILAAICNATIGIFSKYSLNSNMKYMDLALLRCFVAFVLLSVYFAINKKRIGEIVAAKAYWRFIAITAFFGIFLLYFFEIGALTVAPISTVSFLIYAGGSFAVVLSIAWLGETLNPKKLASIVVTLLGMYIMLSLEMNFTLKGQLFAIIAGVGYSMYLVLTKKFEIPNNLAVLWWFFGFGSLYLTIPCLINGFKPPALSAYPFIVALAIIPTIGGFYFTSKALTLIEASKVQIFEMTEPVFASAFALIIFHEFITLRQFFGAALILMGVFILEYSLIGKLFQMKIISAFRDGKRQIEMVSDE